LDGRPEIVARKSGVNLVPGKPTTSGLVPALEVESPLGIDADFARPCGALYCIPTGNGGDELIDAYLQSLIPASVETPETRFELVLSGEQDPLLETGTAQSTAPLPALINLEALGFFDITVETKRSPITRSVAIEVLPYANLAQAAYGEGYSDLGPYVLATDFLKSLDPGFTPEISTGTGLDLKVYQRRKESGQIEITFAFAGTSLSFKDWANNAAQFAFGADDAAQYQDAVARVSQILERIQSYDQQTNMDIEISMTGHSLGGGLAQYVAVQTNVDIDRLITFNSAGLSTQTIKEGVGDGSNIEAVTHVRKQYDPVSGKTGNMIVGDLFQSDTTLVEGALAVSGNAAQELRNDGIPMSLRALRAYGKSYFDVTHDLGRLVDDLNAAAN
jgi:pimeloyl-ACP methyl ester carboxylesterase